MIVNSSRCFFLIRRLIKDKFNAIKATTKLNIVVIYVFAFMFLKDASAL